MENTLLLPGERITEDQSFIKGKNTAHYNGVIVSTAYGTPITINKLLLVEPKYQLTYTGQIGDVIIGRVTGIFNKKWKLDANSPNEVTLQLSAIDLPGLEQRRKMEEDEIKMREYYNIDDLIVSEVQKVFKNGNIAVHTRNKNFRKLTNGYLVDLPVMLVKRYRSQFLNVDGALVIVGMNGKIWIECGDDFDRMIRILRYVQKCKDDKIKIDFDTYTAE